jgi:hypothetical protein
VRTETIRVLSAPRGTSAPAAEARETPDPDAPRVVPLDHLAGPEAQAPETPPHPIPPEAASLVDPDRPAMNCLRCDARNPTYFRHCFNCGARLAQAE